MGWAPARDTKFFSLQVRFVNLRCRQDCSCGCSRRLARVAPQFLPSRCVPPDGRHISLRVVSPRPPEVSLSPVASFLVSLFPMSRAEYQRKLATQFPTLADIEEAVDTNVTTVMGVPRPASVAPRVPAPASDFSVGFWLWSRSLHVTSARARMASPRHFPPDPAPTPVRCSRALDRPDRLPNDLLDENVSGSLRRSCCPVDPLQAWPARVARWHHRLPC